MTRTRLLGAIALFALVLVLGCGKKAESTAQTDLAGPQSDPAPPKPPGKSGPGVPDTLPDADARKVAVANYRKLVLAMLEHADTGVALPGGVSGPGQVLGLSWRVLLLPYIGEAKLYNDFKMEEAWDSAHNKALIEKMPKLFASPGRSAEKGHTFVRIAVGPGGIAHTGPTENGQLAKLYAGYKPGMQINAMRLHAVPDGWSKTILFVEGGAAVPWTKPDDLVLVDRPTGKPDQKLTLPPLGGVFPDGFHAAFADGAVTFYKTDYPPLELAKLFCPDDGLPVDPLAPPDKIGYTMPGVPPKK